MNIIDEQLLAGRGVDSRRAHGAVHQERRHVLVQLRRERRSGAGRHGTQAGRRDRHDVLLQGPVGGVLFPLFAGRADFQLRAVPEGREHRHGRRVQQPGQAGALRPLVAEQHRGLFQRHLADAENRQVLAFRDGRELHLGRIVQHRV